LKGAIHPRYRVTNVFAASGKLFGRKLTPGAYVLRARLSGGSLFSVSFRIKS
jgi:hypothetical protein